MRSSNNKHECRSCKKDKSVDERKGSADNPSRPCLACDSTGKESDEKKDKQDNLFEMWEPHE